MSIVHTAPHDYLTGEYAKVKFPNPVRPCDSCGYEILESAYLPIQVKDLAGGSWADLCSIDCATFWLLY